MESKWQPIETVPRDGSDVLLCCGSYGFRVGSYQLELRIPGDSGGVAEAATHWMCIPAPPVILRVGMRITKIEQLQACPIGTVLVFRPKYGMSTECHVSHWIRAKDLGNVSFDGWWQIEENRIVSEHAHMNLSGENVVEFIPSYT